MARAEAFRDRAPAGQGDEFVERLAACIQQVDSEGTLNAAWVEQCAQDIVVALQSEPSAATSAAAESPAASEPVAAPVVSVSSPPSNPPGVGNTPAEPPTQSEPPPESMPGDARIINECHDRFGSPDAVGPPSLDALMCEESVRDTSESAHCLFFQMVVLGLDMNMASKVCGTLLTEEQPSGVPAGATSPTTSTNGDSCPSSRATPAQPIGLVSALLVVDCPGPPASTEPPAAAAAQAPQAAQPQAVAKPSGRTDNKARCEELVRDIQAKLQNMYSSGFNGAEVTALGNEAQRLGCPPAN